MFYFFPGVPSLKCQMSIVNYQLIAKFVNTFKSDK